MVLLPFDDVGIIAEGAAHHQPRAFFGVDGGIGEDGDGEAKQRHFGFLTVEFGVARILGVAEEGDAGGQQLWTRGHDGQRAAHGDAFHRPIDGKTIAEELANSPDEPRKDQEVIRPWNNPMYKQGHLAILKGWILRLHAAQQFIN